MKASGSIQYTVIHYTTTYKFAHTSVCPQPEPIFRSVYKRKAKMKERKKDRKKDGEKKPEIQ